VGDRDAAHARLSQGESTFRREQPACSPGRRYPASDALQGIESKGRPEMKRVCVLLLVALTAGGVAPAALAAAAPPPSPLLPAPTPAPTVVPPALQALEQKLAQIHLNSVSFSTRLDLEVDNSSSSSSSSIAVSASAASSHTVVIATSGVIGLAPPMLSSVSTIEGLASNEALDGASLQERRIGATIYVYDPSAASHDGGRPWIRSTRSRSEEKLAAKFAPLSDALNPLLAGLERPTATSTGPFAPLLEELDQEQSIQETGPATVDGQQTLGFTLTLSSAKLLDRISSPKERRRPNEGGQSPDTDFTLELWLAPSGLPVRTVTKNGGHGEEFNLQEDILGLEVPVLVHAPPASKTIGQAQWIKIERRRAKAVGRCVRRHPRRAHACLKRLG
jgi:hypothetical protein